MERLKKLLITLLFKVINYLLKNVSMSTSIDDLMQNNILQNLGFINFTPTIVGKSWNLNFVTYELLCSDGTTLTIKLEYLGGCVNFYFVNTTIVRLDVLSSLLDKLIVNLKINQSLLKEYFICHIKRNTP